MYIDLVYFAGNNCPQERLIEKLYMSVYYENVREKWEKFFQHWEFFQFEPRGVFPTIRALELGIKGEQTLEGPSVHLHICCIADKFTGQIS